MYPRPVQQLIEAFAQLPSVGQRSAERFVFHLLKRGKKDVAELAHALKSLMEKIKSCEICWDFSDQSPCLICTDKKRDSYTICVVEQPQAVQTIEKTGAYAGYYHVLRGTLQPDSEASSKLLKIDELVARARQKNLKEIILALNPDLNGETTMMWLNDKISETNPNLIISRLARGLPLGSDLQYADEITIGSALKYRTRS